MSLEMAQKVIIPQKKIMSRIFVNSGTLIVNISRSVSSRTSEYIYPSLSLSRTSESMYPSLSLSRISESIYTSVSLYSYIGIYLSLPISIPYIWIYLSLPVSITCLWIYLSLPVSIPYLWIYLSLPVAIPYLWIYLSLPVSIRISESIYPSLSLYPYLWIYLSLSVSLSVPLNLSVPLWSQGRVEQWFYRRVEEWRRGRVHNASNLSPSRSAQHWFFSPTLTHIVRQQLFFLNSAIARQVFWTERIAIAQKEETSACPPLLSIYLSSVYLAICLSVCPCWQESL